MTKTKKMKWLYSFFALLLMVATIGIVRIPASAASTVKIDKTNFPDSVFRTYVSEHFDTNKDGQLSATEISSATYISLYDAKTLTSLKGIEYLTSLTSLSFNKSKVTSVDLSKNTALTYLYCYNNKLTKLNVTANTKLTSLDCGQNSITSLNVSKNTELTSLYCNSNKITSLDVSKNTKLYNLNCSGNQLKSLDVSKNTELRYLSCYANQISSLDVTKRTLLSSLDCGSNKLSSINVTKNTELTSLYIDNCNLTSIDISKNTKLESFGCSNNKIKSLDISKNTKLRYLSCGSCLLTSLNVTKHPDLTSLYCSYNQLSKLDVSKNTKLESLYISGNKKITSMNITMLSELRWYDCGYTGMKSIDVSKNTKLYTLYCSGNEMTALDVTRNTALQGLSCNFNSLTTLNLSKNTELQTLDCRVNKISKLNLSNNTKLVTLSCNSNKLTALDISKNTKLTQVAVAGNSISKLNISTQAELIKVYKEGEKVTNPKDDPDSYKRGCPSAFYDYNASTMNGKYVRYKNEYNDEFSYLIYGKDTQIDVKPVPLDITLSNVSNGVKITWDKVSGAEKYRVYKKNAKGSWVKLDTVTGAKYTDKNVASLEKCVYSVVALSSDGKELSSIGNGKNIICSLPMKITLKNTETGAQISWTKAGTAAKYRVFRKVGTGDWKSIGTVTTASFVDKTAIYGKSYTYAVRAMNAKSAFISEIGKGKTLTYFAPAPKTSVENGTLGVNITWKKISNATKYRIFVQNAKGGWDKLATVKSGLKYTDKTAKNGQTYTYAVVGMDSAGRLMNKYKGVTITRTAPTMSITLKSVAVGVKISWEAAEGAGKYRVFRKNASGEWDTLGTVKDGSLFFRDTTAKSGKTYTYTVVAMTKGGTVLTKKGSGQTIKYVKPKSDAEVLEAEITDENGNVIIYKITGDEINEDYIEIGEEDEDVISEDEEETSEDEDVISEDEEETSEEEAISEDEEETSEEEAISEDEEETSEEEAISEDEEETSEEEAISEDEEETSEEEAISEDTEEESGEDVIAEEPVSEETSEDAGEENAEETVNSEITEEVQE